MIFSTIVESEVTHHNLNIKIQIVSFANKIFQLCYKFRCVRFERLVFVNFVGIKPWMGNILLNKISAWIIVFIYTIFTEVILFSATVQCFRFFFRNYATDKYQHHMRRPKEVFVHPHKEQKIASFIVNACVNMVSLNLRFICTDWEPRDNTKPTKHFLLFPLKYKKYHHYYCILYNTYQ